MELLITLAVLGSLFALAFIVLGVLEVAVYIVAGIKAFPVKVNNVYEKLVEGNKELLERIQAKKLAKKEAKELAKKEKAEKQTQEVIEAVKEEVVETEKALEEKPEVKTEVNVAEIVNEVTNQ